MTPGDRMTFKDHFSGHARQYAAFRPTYPDSVFATLAELAPGRRRAWDCATGSGQAAVGLVRHVGHVVATDASVRQLASAQRHDRVSYCVARAEEAPIGNHTVELVTIAQALHWVNVERFFAEAARALVPGGIFAAWGYGNPSVSEDVDPILTELYEGTLGPYWPPERRMIEDAYEGVAMPFDRIDVPATRLERAMSLEEFEGYVRTWSGTVRYLAARATDPVRPAFDAMAPRWGPPGSRRPVRWPLFFLVGRA